MSKLFTELQYPTIQSPAFIVFPKGLHIWIKKKVGPYQIWSSVEGQPRKYPWGSRVRCRESSPSHSIIGKQGMRGRSGNACWRPWDILLQGNVGCFQSRLSCLSINFLCVTLEDSGVITNDCGIWWLNLLIFWLLSILINVWICFFHFLMIKQTLKNIYIDIKRISISTSLPNLSSICHHL